MAELIRAWAKLTLSLRITGVRPDGWHLLDAEMVTVDLCDDLELSPGNGLVVVDEAGGGLPVAPGEHNLVTRALAAAGRTASVRVVKRIPAGAGLGGGSADAAAVLRWAGVTDLRAGVALGADVPFCMRGGRARVRGVGEIVDPRPCRSGEPLTLLIPPLSVPTPAAYRAWDRLGGPTAPGPNDLEPAALAVEPELARWRDQLGDATGLTPVLAGSGSAWWVPGAFEDVPGTRVVRTICP